MPSLILYGLNRDDEDYWEVPQWERDIAWHIPMRDGEGERYFLRVMKPFEMGKVFGTLPERTIAWIDSRPNGAGETREFARNFGTDMVGALMPEVTALKPLVENLVNHSMFFDRPITPRSEADVSPELQGDDRTSEVAKMLGRATGTSPRKWDNVLYSLDGRARPHGGPGHRPGDGHGARPAGETGAHGGRSPSRQGGRPASEPLPRVRRAVLPPSRQDPHGDRGPSPPRAPGRA